MYIAPLAGLIRSFGVRYHQYADDSQLYVSVSRNNQEDIQLATFEQCLSKVHDWLLHNGLSPNPAKSNAVQFATGRGRRDEVESISVSGAAIKPAASVKSLGVTLDSRLSLDQYITNVCKSC